MSSYLVSKNPPPPAHGSDDAAAVPVPPVTSRLYLHRPGTGAGALDRDAVLRRIRHRRRHNRLRDTLCSMLQVPPPPQEAEVENTNVELERQHLPWPLDDAFSAP